MTRAGPDWLAELQARFGHVLRTPLDRTSGTLTATPEAYDPGLVAEASRGAGGLAIYNRQYWFRLFEMLLDAFPLTASLLGAWSFHAYSSQFLQTQPPRGWDLERASEGFADFFAARLEDRPDRTMLVESVRIDDAWLRIFRAPAVPAFRPTAGDAARLLDAWLVPSPAVAMIEEHAPLVALRRTLSRGASHARLTAPPPHDGARRWAIVRTDTGTLQLELEAHERELHRLLEARPLRDALAQLEGSLPTHERATLPARTQAWLARGITHGFWTGLRDEAP